MFGTRSRSSKSTITNLFSKCREGTFVRDKSGRRTPSVSIHQYICGSRPLSRQTPVTSALVSVTSWVGVSCRSFPFSKSMSEDNELGASQSGHAVSKVPLDVWHLVTAWLEPLGLLKLSMTSKWLYDILMNDRYIWNREARRLMTQESVLTAPIPLDEMSMKDLRNFSLHPYRFRANLLRGTIEISREREFELGGPSLRNSRCLPGGRYVVGLGKAEGSACELLCWDLKDTRTERVLNPVARFMLPSSNLNGCYFQFGVEHGHRSYITFSVLCSVGRLHTSWTHDVVRLECVQNSDGPVMRFVKVGA
ncbi:uncharacterized protein EI90DRAFT_2574318 [Cantharellus anzutake]|uniref:uncharacterized protein n=1 Tax=Cantharellus anzutake TaxID=1750568 RepID=UPI0019085A42|nr:uncharacterized protein EI90DRAFT_2574318 [Cantharellus anzutake]KAF8321072.1 hypothetical protein EI90DRAFT_2574318 [Cantharellus anzutake]